MEMKRKRESYRFKGKKNRIEFITIRPIIQEFIVLRITF